MFPCADGAGELTSVSLNIDSAEIFGTSVLCQYHFHGRSRKLDFVWWQNLSLVDHGKKARRKAGLGSESPKNVTEMFRKVNVVAYASEITSEK